MASATQMPSRKRWRLRLHAGPLRTWRAIHRWSSLVCTAFLLIACITGLPLVFQNEVSNLGAARSHWPNDATAKRSANLDRILARSRELYPGQVVTSVFIDDDEPYILVSMAPSFAARRANPGVSHFMRFNALTGESIKLAPSDRGATPITKLFGVARAIHEDLFLGSIGELVLASAAALFVVSIVSGIILYGPFTEKLDFGEIRVRRVSRVRWLDLHNLLGATTLAWALVVGTTGVMNELSTPLFKAWNRTNEQTVLASYRNQPPLAPSRLASTQNVVETAGKALHNMHVFLVVFPGAETSGPHHYLVWGRGDAPLTKRLSIPVLVDGATGKITAILDVPWYLRTLQLSRPLHFGDYGGLPLKIIWALLDLVTIVVLGSGLYLWLSRSRSPSGAPIPDLDAPKPDQVTVFRPAE